MYKQSQINKYVTPLRTDKEKPLLLTNLVQRENPNNTLKMLKIIMPILFFLLIWSIIQVSNNQKKQLQDQYQNIQQNKEQQKYYQQSNQIDVYLNKLIKLNPNLLVPIIETISPQMSVEQVNKKLLEYSQEISFYQELKRKGLQTKQYDEKIKEYISSNSKKLNLTIIKHQKLTSPIQKKGLFKNMFKMFKWKNDDYEQIQDILKSNKNVVWRASGNLLAVSTQVCFRPKGLFITIPQNQQIFASKVHIFGLVLQEQLVAASKSLTKNYLGSHTIKKGRNYIPCSSLQCHQLYSIIIIVLDPMIIENLQIFGRKEQL